MEAVKKESLLELAARLGPGKKRDKKPSREENDLGWALCAGALRRGDAAGLDRLLGELGFVPDAPSHGEALLWLAASGPGAVGFMELARAVVRESDMPGWERSIGERLRAPMAVSAGQALEPDSRQERIGTDSGKRGFSPVLAALSADAPEALAQLLMEPGWLDELIALEPPVFDGEWSEKASERREQIKQSGAALEVSLAGAALSTRAGACLALLMEIPELSAAAVEDRLHSADMASHPSRRKSQHVFPEPPSDESAGLFGRAKAQTPSYSFFEGALIAREGSPDRRMDLAIDAMIERANPSAIQPQAATGMLWGHMLFSRAALWSKEAEAQMISRLRRLAERGFPMGWETLADGMLRKDKKELAEWALLQEAALPAVKRARAPGL